MVFFKELWYLSEYRPQLQPQADPPFQPQFPVDPFTQPVTLNQLQPVTQNQPQPVTQVQQVAVVGELISEHKTIITIYRLGQMITNGYQIIPM